MRLGDVSVAFVSVQKQTTAHTLMDFPIYCMSNPSSTGDDQILAAFLSAPPSNFPAKAKENSKFVSHITSV